MGFSELTGNLFGSDSDSDEEQKTELKYDTFSRKNGEELVMALVKKHHSLWGEYIYNAARVVAEWIDQGKHPAFDCKGKRVLELGAGAGLPGLMAGLCGASLVCLTDYGTEFDRGLLEAMEKNILDFRAKYPLELAGTDLCAAPYIWGNAVDRLLESSFLESRKDSEDEPHGGASSTRFDIVIMADCIFNRSEVSECFPKG